MKESERVLAQVREERFKLMQMQIKRSHLWSEMEKVKAQIKEKQDYISTLVALAEDHSKQELEEQEK